MADEELAWNAGPHLDLQQNFPSLGAVSIGFIVPSLICRKRAVRGV